MSNTVLILGASGKIGQHATAAFQKAGWQVRSYDRAKNNMTEAAQGADVIINGMNPANYNNWQLIIPAITGQVIAAAKASGATVIIPGNVYNFGGTQGVWSENTPQKPVSRKGQIRVDMEQAYRASGVSTIILRAGSFIDPNRADDVMGLLILREIGKDKVCYAGGADVMQAYCYLPDWARSAVLLAEKRHQLENYEDIPFPGHAFTITALHETLQAETGRALKLVAFPWWFMTLASPFWKLARELREMRYLWNTAHEISGEKFARLLPDFEATDLRSVMTAGLPAKVHPDQRMPGRPGVSLA